MTFEGSSSSRSLRVTPWLGAPCLLLAIATLYFVRYHAPASPLLHSLLMPAAALALCFGAVAILVPVTTGRAWLLHRPPAGKAWRLRVLAGLSLLWATFAVPAMLPAGAPALLTIFVVLVSLALLFAAAMQLAHALVPWLDSASPTSSRQP